MAKIIRNQSHEPLGKGSIGCFAVVVIIIALALSGVPAVGPLLTIAVLVMGLGIAWSMNQDRKKHAAAQESETIAGELLSEPGLKPPVPMLPQAQQVSLLGEPVQPDKISFWTAKKTAQNLTQQNAALRHVIEKHDFSDVVVMEETRASLNAAITDSEANALQLRTEVEAIQSELISVRTKADLQRVGLFDFEHPAESSATLKGELEQVRTEIKRIARAKDAIRASSGFTFNGSEKEGKKFVKQMSTVMLRAYNAEAENCVKTVRAGNLDTAIKRLETARDMIERNTTLIDLHIGTSYHKQRIKELELAAKHLQAVAAEKEEERARREELREQRKVEAEIARKREQLDREMARYQETYRSLVAQGNAEGAARMSEKMKELEDEQHRIEEYESNFRLGHVYVISNIGAFGDGVVKIGMTRRQEPMDRVRELGDASVPFRFDVHALFFTEDAVGVENMLHKHFSDQRVNKVNGRKEFFYATPEEVLAALQEHAVEVVQYDTDAEAEEYRMSRGVLSGEAV